MQREAVEEIDVAQMETEIVAFEHPAVAQEYVVLLSADGALRRPAAGELGVVQQALLTARPREQRGGFAAFQATDFSGRWPCRRRRRAACAMNSSGDIGGCLERRAAERCIRLV